LPADPATAKRLPAGDFPLDVAGYARIMRHNLPGEPMNIRHVLRSDDRPDTVPSGSPLPLFFRCIAGQRSVDQKERPLIAGAFFCPKFECAATASTSFKHKETGE